MNSKHSRADMSPLSVEVEMQLNYAPNVFISFSHLYVCSNRHANVSHSRWQIAGLGSSLGLNVFLMDISRVFPRGSHIDTSLSWAIVHKQQPLQWVVLCTHATEAAAQTHAGGGPANRPDLRRWRETGVAHYINYGSVSMPGPIINIKRHSCVHPYCSEPTPLC